MALLSKKETDGDSEMATDFHFPTSKRALIIFTRNPELGQCKTRLAESIGDESALEIYNYLLAHTAKISKNVNADRYVYYSKYIIKEDCWDVNDFRKKLQQGNNLGEKMQNAFSDLFQMGYKKVVIIGSDLLDLDSEIIEEAYDQLEINEVVIGPATDGGYYLLGLKNLQAQLFENKKWGTDSVLNDTLKELQNTPVSLLKELNDIDIFDDLKPYPQLHKLYNRHD